MIEPSLATETTASAAVVARSLLDGPFLDHLGDDLDGALATMALPPAVRAGLGDLDTGRLALVAAFVAKVKHNDLWSPLPRTRRLLRDRGSELDLFARHARWPAPPGDRVGAFVAFLIADLGPDDVVVDVARHELIVHRLREAGGGLAVGAFGHDPAAFLDDGDVAAVARVAEPVHVGYRWTGDALRMVRVDPLTALVLTAVADGAATLDEIRDRVGARCADPEAVRAALEGSAERGLLDRPVPAGAGLVDLLEGYLATQALHRLHHLGVLDRLATPQAVEDVAEGHDPVWLGHLLEHLARRTSVVERLADGRYRVAPTSYEQLGFVLDKLVGAYGPCLDHDGPAPEAVDGTVLAQAFDRVTAERDHPGAAPSTTTMLLEGWDVAADVVDLGCGSGGVLAELVGRDPDRRGIGIDQNPAMVAAARTALDATGAADRVEVRTGDAVDVLAALPPARRATITALHGRSFLNACFGAGVDGAARVIARLVEAVPGRLLFVDDYYGELSDPQGDGATTSRRWAELQDVVQAWSGQGVPPPDREGWAAVYAGGGARLLHSYEDEVDGFRRFVHVVLLGREGR